MKITKGFIDFNKEILFGEIGAILGIQFVSYLCSKSDYSVVFISYLVVIGAIVGASLFWFGLRIYDKTRKRKYPEKVIIEDILYYTPAAFILTSLLYYPTLFFANKYFLEHNRMIEFSATLSQVLAFVLFLIGINLYRYFLSKYYKKVL